MPGLTENISGVVDLAHCGKVSAVNPVKMLLLAEGLAGDVLLVRPPRVEHLEGRFLHQVRVERLISVVVQILEARHGVHSTGTDLITCGDVAARSVLDLEALDSVSSSSSTGGSESSAHRGWLC